MNVLSLFDGISCGMVALERTGIKVDRYVAYEIEKDAIKVSNKNYPQIEHKGDVFKAQYIDGEFDLLIGGSPCTHWSIAKGNYGREKTASGIGWELFTQYLRALWTAKPRYFLYENNYTMSDEIRESISEELGCKPILIDSADFSAQHRLRYYWTNIPLLPYEKSPLIFEDIMDDKGPFTYRDFSKYADSVKISQNGLDVKYDTSGKGYYSQENRAKKPNQKWNTLCASLKGSNTYNDIWVDKYLARHLTAVEMERLQTLPDGYTSCLKSAVKSMHVTGNGWTVDVIAHILRGIKEKI